MSPEKNPSIIALTEGYDGLGAALTSWMFSLCLAGFGYRTILIQTDASPIDYKCEQEDSIRKQLSQHLQGTCIPCLQTLVLPVEDTVNRNQQFETFIRSIHALPAEYIVLDLGNARTEFDLIALAFSDIPLYLITDEAPSVIKAYNLVRSTLLTKLNIHMNEPEIQQRFIQCGVLSDGPFLYPVSSVFEKLAEQDPFLYEKACSCKNMLQPRILMLNRKRRIKHDYYQLLGSALKEYLDLCPAYWGTMCEMHHLYNSSRQTWLNTCFREFNASVVSLVVRHMLKQNSDITPFYSKVRINKISDIPEQANNLRHDKIFSLN